eukprot:7520767-Ditylum_brightwellii.AAC.1
MDLENPKNSAEWGQTDLLEEIFKYPALHNSMHFGKTHRTVFTVPPLSHAVDWGVNSILSKVILQSQYNNEKLSNLQTMLLKHFTREFGMAAIGEEIC